MLLSYAAKARREEEKFPIEDGRIPFNGLFDISKDSKNLQLVSEERNPSSCIGDSAPVRLFPQIRRDCKSLRFPKLGINPENELAFISKLTSVEAFVMEFGIGPVRLLWLNKRRMRLKSEAPMSEGRVPQKLLNERAISFNDDMLNTKDGMGP